jgi:hypothetical protein
MQYLLVSDIKQQETMNIPVVDTPFAGLVVDIKVLKVVVEIDATGTQVSTEQSSVGGEDGGDVNVPLSAKGDSETSLPFVEVGDNGGLGLSAGELDVSSSVLICKSGVDSRLRGTMRQCNRRR